MAAPIIITVGLDTGDARLAAQQLAAELRTALNGIQQQSQRVGRGIGGALTGGLSGVLQSYRQFASSASGILSSIGIATSFAAIAKASIDAAVQIDKSRQTIAALTGSVEIANQKLRQLRELSQTSPGVTTQLAADVFAQFKALGDVTDVTIERVTKSIGRLNAVFGLADPAQFARNLSQIFAQGFERGDIKEALGQVATFEQILQQAFGQNAEGLRKLKEAGKLTREQFLLGISEAIDQDPNLAKISESLGTRLAKSFETLKTRLEPVGLFILNILTPVVVALDAALAKFEPELKSILENVLGVIRAFSNFYQTINQIIPVGKIVETTIKGMALLFAFLRDSVELSIAQIELRLGSLIATTRDALAFVGVQFDSLNRIADRFAARRAQNEQRIAQGFVNEQQALAIIRGQLSNINLPTTGRFEGQQQAVRAGLADSIKTVNDKAIQDAKQFKEAQEQVERDRVDALNRIFRQEAELRIQAFSAQYEQGLITLKEFYDQKQSLESLATTRELAALEANAETLRDKLKETTLTSMKRLDVEKQLIGIYGQQADKVNDLNKTLQQNFDDYKKRLALPSLDLTRTQQEQVTEFVDPRVQAARDKIEQARALQEQRDLSLIDLGRQRIEIENQVEQGVLSQADAREQINALLRQERDLRLAVLEAEKASVDITPKRRAEIESEIASIRN
ncbi:MAG: hypothetical protein EBR82_50330, partial [Caulobacteraceae bacterium]|nr:hypothetical protein [Caulobacteraceae bacterium]